MSVKHGPVTLLSAVEAAEGRLRLLVAEGESVRPDPGDRQHEQSLPIFHRRGDSSNPGTSMAPPIAAVGVGHIAGMTEKLNQLLQMEVAKVC